MDFAFDAEALDLLEQRLWGEIWETAPTEVSAEHGVEKRQFGPVQATMIADLPSQPWLNLVLGATAPDAVEGGHLAEAIGWADSLGVSYYVPVTPGMAGTGGAQGWLEQNGFEQGYAWMKFIHDRSTPELPEPEGIEVVELAAGEGGDFGSIVAEGFELPAWAAELFAGLPGSEGWRCYVALVDGSPAASGAMKIEQGGAEFGLAATLEKARGRGCQLGLLRRRILDALTAGCHTLFVETGERVADRPSGSYRNILRAGFLEAYLRPNWQRRRG
jgi:hypothetical protein